MSRFRSSSGAFREFMAGSVWADMKIEINGAIETLRDGLETAKDYDSVLRYQECLDTLRRVLIMPEVILDDIEESQKPKREAVDK